MNRFVCDAVDIAIVIMLIFTLSVMAVSKIENTSRFELIQPSFDYHGTFFDAKQEPLRQPIAQ
jgi:hypothetical protein